MTSESATLMIFILSTQAATCMLSRDEVRVAVLALLGEDVPVRRISHVRQAMNITMNRSNPISYQRKEAQRVRYWTEGTVTHTRARAPRANAPHITHPHKQRHTHTHTHPAI